MKMNVSRKNRTFLKVNILFLIISLAYIILFEFYLREISALTYTLTYRLINDLLARPIFYVSLFAVLGKLFFLASKFTLSTTYRHYSMSIIVFLLSLYILSLIIYNFFSLPSTLSYLLILFIQNNSILFILLGILLSLTIPRCL